MVIHDKKSKKTYQLFEHSNEDSFERLVVSLANEIFGNDTIYIDIKKRVKGGDLITIPDGYLIDLTSPENPKLYVIENEIVAHDPFKHIGIQLLKFATSFEDGRTTIRNFLMTELEKNESHLQKLESACKKSNYRNIDNYLDSAVYSDFKAIVIIDDARPELHNVLEKIRADISVLELKTYVTNDGSHLYQFDTFYDDPEDQVTQTKKTDYGSPELLERKRLRRANCDTIVVPARDEGFQQVFLGEHRWFAVRIGAAMKDKIKYIAAYEVSPVSGISYVAKIKEIRPYKDTGKYEIIFEEPAKKINTVKLENPAFSPQSPIYIEYKKLESANSLDELLKY